MRTYSLAELYCLTRAELFALHAEIVAGIDAVADNGDRHVALGNLALIRRALSRHGPSP